jgi:rubrerythrin
MENKNIEELLSQALATEKGGVLIYEAAIAAARNEELKEEWRKYLEQTRRHVEIVTGILSAFGLDAETMTPGAEIVKMKGEALVASIKKAQEGGDPAAAELVAAEAVVDAETKDHMNWELLAELAKKSTGERKEILKKAVDEVEEQEDQHLYHTQGWTRELWLQAIGLPAVLPPPEEVKDVDTEIGAARAKQGRGRMLRRGGRRRSRGGSKTTA